MCPGLLFLLLCHPVTRFPLVSVIYCHEFYYLLWATRSHICVLEVKYLLNPKPRFPSRQALLMDYLPEWLGGPTKWENEKSPSTSLPLVSPFCTPFPLSEKILFCFSNISQILPPLSVGTSQLSSHLIKVQEGLGGLEVIPLIKLHL